MTWCWWCCHPHDNESLKLPYKYDDKYNKYFTTGTFCSWSCMKAYNMSSSCTHKKNIISANIVLMRKQLFGIVGSIPKAPERFSLKVFGGFLSIDDFRKGLITDHGPLNMDGIVNSVEFIKEQRAPILNSIKMDQICASSGTNEQLRLKRPKPLKRDDNNLEKTLGITRKKVVT